MPREKVEPTVGGAFETGWEHVTQEVIIVRVNRHQSLGMPEVLDVIGRPRVAHEAQHYELFGEVVKGDFY